MKQLLPLLLLLLSGIVRAQSSERVVYSIREVDTPPYFSGCEHLEEPRERLKCSERRQSEYITKRLVVPAEGWSGAFLLSFIVEEENGALTNIELRNHQNTPVGKSMLKCIEEMPNWQPATLNGKPVAVAYPLLWKLNFRKTIPD